MWTERGFEGKLLGRATFDPKTERFVAFELVAVGERWGATRYNFRTDLDRSPFGFASVLAGDKPIHHVAPAFVDNYGW